MKKLTKYRNFSKDIGLQKSKYLGIHFDRNKGLLVKLYEQSEDEIPIQWHKYQPSPHDVAKACKYYNDKFVESAEKSEFKIVHVNNEEFDRLNVSEPKWGSLAHMQSIGINIDETSSYDPVLQEINDTKLFSLGTVLVLINKVNIKLNITELTETLNELSLEINKLLYDFYLYDTVEKGIIDTVQVDFLAKIVSLLIDLIKYAVIIFENLDNIIDQIKMYSGIDTTQEEECRQFLIILKVL